MAIQHLIKLANNIGNFFEVEPDRAKGKQGIATHIKNFWEPRMRRELLAYLDSNQGEGLSEVVLEAIRAHREELTPRDR